MKMHDIFVEMLGFLVAGVLSARVSVE